MRVESIGYLVPWTFDGTVHSVFAHACNLVCGGSLLTVAAAGVPAAPTTLVLASQAAIDLRARYRLGETVVRRGARLASRRVVVDLTGARVWRPPAQAPIADRVQVEANLRRCRARLEARLPERASVLHREACDVCAHVERACAVLDHDAALAHASRLVGWGEGLTPAGDDFLVGLLAALHRMASRFAARFGGAIAMQCDRTTAIAAHALRLAALGHVSAELLSLRDAMLCSDDCAALDRLADAALDVGATSGVDRVTGLVAGVSASIA